MGLGGSGVRVCGVDGVRTVVATVESDKEKTYIELGDE
jgi:hypothetical protein